MVRRKSISEFQILGYNSYVTYWVSFLSAKNSNWRLWWLQAHQPGTGKDWKKPNSLYKGWVSCHRLHVNLNQSSLTSLINQAYLPTELPLTGGCFMHHSIETVQIAVHENTDSVVSEILKPAYLASPTLSKVTIKVTEITFFHILMLDMNMNCGSWLVPTLFYALCHFHMIG